jgi:hypothetical protein
LALPPPFDDSSNSSLPAIQDNLDGSSDGVDLPLHLSKRRRLAEEETRLTTEFAAVGKGRKLGGKSASAEGKKDDGGKATAGKGKDVKIKGVAGKDTKGDGGKVATKKRKEEGSGGEKAGSAKRQKEGASTAEKGKATLDSHQLRLSTDQVGHLSLQTSLLVPSSRYKLTLLGIRLSSLGRSSPLRTADNRAFHQEDQEAVLQEECSPDQAGPAQDGQSFLLLCLSRSDGLADWFPPCLG